MLEKERFLAIKKLAKDIRNENKTLLKKIEKMPSEKAIDEKNKFIDSVMENMTDAFSGGEQGKEEKQIFRANILIPDDEEFYDTYSNNKNIRNLMAKYSVNIEDIMSKITELNIYGKYLEESTETEEESGFVDEMVKIFEKRIQKKENSYTSRERIEEEFKKEKLDRKKVTGAILESFIEKPEKDKLNDKKPKPNDGKNNNPNEDNIYVQLKVKNKGKNE